MRIYDSFGTFDDIEKEFNLAVQTTNIGFDRYYISAYYDICNNDRYAILAILQTKLENEKDLREEKANDAVLNHKIKFSDLKPDYVDHDNDDLDINNATKEDTIHVIVHHAIGFDPKTNRDDDQNIKDYKSGVLPLSLKPRGSRPAVGGRGIMK